MCTYYRPSLSPCQKVFSYTIPPLPFILIICYITVRSCINIYLKLGSHGRAKAKREELSAALRKAQTK